MKSPLRLSLILSAVAAVMLGACTDDNDDASLSLSTKSLEFGATETAAKEITVTTNAAWEAKPDKEWITVTPSGNMFSVTVDENTLQEDRTGTITVKGSGVETVSVLQRSANQNTLTVEPSELRFSEWGDPQSVTVTTDAAEWSAEPGADWITTTTEGNTLTVKVGENTLKEERTAVVTITAGNATFPLPIAQDGKVYKTEVKIFHELMGAMFNRVSSNGRYCVGFVPENFGFYYDRATGQMTTVDGLEGTVDYNRPIQSCEATDISNDGTVVGVFRSPDVILYHKDENGNQTYDDNGDPMISNPTIPGFWRNGSWTELERLDDEVPLVGGDLDGWATSITADGKYAVGTVHVPGDVGWGRVNPCIWDLSTGKLKQRYEGCAQGQGGNAYNVSDDGTIAVGWVDKGDNIRYAAVWTESGMTALDKGSEMFGISPNGKHFGGQYNWDPCWWSPEKGITQLPVHLGQEGGGSAASLADDGTTIGFSSDIFGMTRLPFIIAPDGTFYDLVEYLEDVYGYVQPGDLLPPDAPAGTDLSTYLFVPLDISADGKVIVGYTALFEPWIITLGEPVAK